MHMAIPKFLNSQCEGSTDSVLDNIILEPFYNYILFLVIWNVGVALLSYDLEG